MLLTAVTLLAAVGMSHGSICCMAGRFDAVEYFQQATVVEGVPHVTEGQAAVSIDSDLQMTNAYVASSTDGKTPIEMRIIEDFKSMTMYTVTSDGQQCDKTPLTTNWTGVCIPDGSQKSSSTYFGMSPSVFDVDSYAVPYAALPDVKVYVTASRADCTIMTESLKGTTGGVPFIANFVVYNATVGIRDPSVFKIPPSCSSAKKVQTSVPFRVRAAVMP